MRTSTMSFTSADGTTIHVERWHPDTEPVGVLQLAHGMGEHARRYAHLAEVLTTAGWEVAANDHRGHGHSAGHDEVGPGGLGDLGPGGWQALVDDVGYLHDLLVAEHPEVPHVLLAHSMGSFAAQLWVLDHSGEIDALVLSGSTALDVAATVMDPDAGTDLTALNAAFEPARTPYDWLSRDDAQVDRYLADPHCGFGLDAEGTRGLVATAARAADPAALANVRDDLPIYLVAGSADPLNLELSLLELVVQRYRDAGVRDVRTDFYHEARHELFNEINRDEVIAGLLDWLSTAVPAEPTRR